MQSLADQMASMRELLQQNLANGVQQQQQQTPVGDMNPESQEAIQKRMYYNSRYDQS